MTKTTGGFVTNSSSTSFVLIGRQAHTLEATPGNELVCLGQDVYEGQDVFVLTDEMLGALKDAGLAEKFIETYEVWDADVFVSDASRPNEIDLKGAASILAGLVDDHSSYHISVFTERYIDDIEGYE
jgi:hypothetical protein